MIRLQNVCQWGNGKNSCTSSRREILAWVNDNLNTSFMRLEDLCSGVQYCQMLHKLRPSAINLKKVIVNTRAQHEFVRNMKLLQRSLLKQGIEKQIPILRLVARGYRETLEFSQWFKAFYDRNYILLQDEIAQDKKNRTAIKIMRHSIYG
ncbi:microtubule-associated protein RP/EB family member 2 [Drosophila subpulchrella]|uniref:microtubule-associated protein RP/EB family member 2 n=1 Tax=Drosophila subpulchrella TaxID=1486046 RepID=UPI0018A18460|nr:microtubule-associated protein RP/EB family member 2 [Drosophila subpulchrella]